MRNARSDRSAKRSGIEDLLALRGVTVMYESVCRWCLKFGPMYQLPLKPRETKGKGAGGTCNERGQANFCDLDVTSRGHAV